jgi:glycosyltransferase involved in cell wall biosynthesis
VTRVLIATDAWDPQVNGVVQMLRALEQAAPAHGLQISFLTPLDFPTVPLPSYASIQLALPRPGVVRRLLDERAAEAVHIATEGPIGVAVRRHCLARGIRFTTSFMTRFPEYLRLRTGLPERWAWAWLRRFHAPAAAVMVPTRALAEELTARGFRNVAVWPPGVDTELFRPRLAAPLAYPRPVFLYVGRVAVEKNLDAFLSLDLPGRKVVVGDGPALAALRRRYPSVLFTGVLRGAPLAWAYAAADVFVFPSRTDTFGLVLLEALASGLPVAALPAQAPRHLLGASAVGALDEDLGRACLRALQISRPACRAFAEGMTWSESARRFHANLQAAHTALPHVLPAALAAHST